MTDVVHNISPVSPFSLTNLRSVPRNGLRGIETRRFACQFRDSDMAARHGIAEWYRPFPIGMVPEVGKFVTNPVD